MRPVIVLIYVCSLLLKGFAPVHALAQLQPSAKDAARQRAAVRLIRQGLVNNSASFSTPELQEDFDLFADDNDPEDDESERGSKGHYAGTAIVAEGWKNGYQSFESALRSPENRFRDITLPSGSTPARHVLCGVFRI